MGDAGTGDIPALDKYAHSGEERNNLGGILEKINRIRKVVSCASAVGVKTATQASGFTTYREWLESENRDGHAGFQTGRLDVRAEQQANRHRGLHRFRKGFGRLGDRRGSQLGDSGSLLRIVAPLNLLRGPSINFRRFRNRTSIATSSVISF
jgi:hypothetical protein